MRAKVISGYLSLLFLFLLFQPVSIAAVISDDASTLMAVGDVMLGRHVESRYHGRIRSDEISRVFRSADVVFGNLEACFGGGNSPFQKRAVNLKAPDNALSVLKSLGFTVISLANNHCMDFGSDAVFHTQALLESGGLKSFGGFSTRGKAIPLILSINSAKIGFLGYSAHVTTAAHRQPGDAGIAPLSSESVLKDIAALRSQVDILIASIHWGREFSDKPTASQTRMAHQMVDAGVDAIWGHHPHVLQGIENYRGSLIAYSLGNFIFDQIGTSTTQSMILRCGIRNQRIYDVKVIPVMLDRYLPRLANIEESIAIMNRVRRLSDELTLDADVSAWRIQWSDGRPTIGGIR